MSFDIGEKTLPSVMQHSFSRIPQARIPRSQFRRPRGYPMTFSVDYLIPIYVDEVLPADTVSLNMSSIVRLPALLTPFMDNLYLDCFFFYVPNRLIWTNWQRFMGERDPDPDSSIDFIVPYMDSTATTGYANESLHDYLEVPTQVPDLRHDSLWHRAYNLIWNEWFRDQNLQNSVVVDKDDGPDDPADYVLLKRGKRHDYFTSCLPWPQKGDAVTLPLGSQAPISSDAAQAGILSIVSTAQSGAYKRLAEDGSGYSIMSGVGGLAGDRLYADMEEVTGATIQALYESFSIQDLLQTDARGGTRYVELINAHFGVTSPDFRLQRPEYLGGSSYPFMVNPLAQTSETGTTELGTLAATGTGLVSNFRLSKSFVEHGVIIGLAAVRADLKYQQGLPRRFSRSTRYDFYFPALANLGEQEVLNKEIYAQGSADAAADAAVFGYQERWAEYRYAQSIPKGKMRSNDAQSLDIWHLVEEFASLPSLNASFIEQNTPIDRVLAVEGEPDIKADFFFDDVWVRPLPLYSVPGLQNRF